MSCRLKISTIKKCSMRYWHRNCKKITYTICVPFSLIVPVKYPQCTLPIHLQFLTSTFEEKIYATCIDYFCSSIVLSVNIQGRSLVINFNGRLAGYVVTELDELLHAYVNIMHKAQSSEYSVVVISVLMSR